MQQEIATGEANQALTEMQTSSAMEGRYLTFWIDKQIFGISIQDVVQIIGMQEIYPVPEYPDYAKGFINLRDVIIPVIDVRIRLKKSEKEYDERTCIIVTNINESSVGFIVDEVDEVTEISDEMFSQPPKLINERVNIYLKGIGKIANKVVLIMNTAKLLSDDEIETLIKVN